MYYIVAFHPEADVRKIWARTEAQVVGLIKEGFTVYRTGTDQIACLDGEASIVWADVKETPNE